WRRRPPGTSRSAAAAAPWCSGARRADRRRPAGSWWTRSFVGLQAFPGLVAQAARRIEPTLQDGVETQVVEEYSPHEARQQFAHHDDGDESNQDRGDEIVVKALECREQCAADAARAHDAHHGGVAQVGVELISGKADE